MCQKILTRFSESEFSRQSSAPNSVGRRQAVSLIALCPVF